MLLLFYALRGAGAREEPRFETDFLLLLLQPDVATWDRGGAVAPPPNLIGDEAG